jgi:hypothetical protein
MSSPREFVTVPSYLTMIVFHHHIRSSSVTMEVAGREKSGKNICGEKRRKYKGGNTLTGQNMWKLF